MIIEIPFEIFGFSKIQIETLNPEWDLLKSLPDSGFAIVGTRYPQRKSFEFLEKTIHDLRDTGLIIVSGFARGIDSRAHELAVDSGLKTLAILGCGLNIDYPRENRHLRKKILDHGGWILSPFEADAPALPHHFLNRNQLIAHFSKAVWVVEAASISGSLNTANHAFHLNRDLYATPCFPDDTFYEGNQKLLSQKETDKYPIADPFFGVHSLLKTWERLSLPEKRKKE